MGADALEIDAEGLSVFPPEPAYPPAEGLDVATALAMEQVTLLREDLDRCNIQQGGKAVSSSVSQNRQVSLG